MNNQQEQDFLKECCEEYGVELTEITDLMKIEEDYALQTRKSWVYDALQEKIEDTVLDNN